MSPFDTSGAVLAPRSDGCKTGIYPWKWEELDERTQGWIRDIGFARFADVQPDLLAAMMEGKPPAPTPLEERFP